MDDPNDLIPSGNQTWLAGKSLRKMEVLICLMGIRTIVNCYVWWPEVKYYQVTTPTWQKTLSAVEPVVGIYINQPENLIHQLGYKPKIDV